MRKRSGWQLTSHVCLSPSPVAQCRTRRSLLMLLICWPQESILIQMRWIEPELPSATSGTVGVYALGLETCQLWSVSLK